MKTVYAADHIHHAPAQEFSVGRLQPCFEKPVRAESVYEVMKAKGADIIAPQRFPIEALTAVHDAGYVAFLQNAFAAWQASGETGDAFASALNVQHPGARPPRNIDGQLGYYMADGTVPLTASSWTAIESSAFTALTAQKLVARGERAAFALCRPPGHHASSDCAAGYCFLNNAAIAAQKFRADGARRVAILDVDYHHGNGTQEIFYSRDDVIFSSLHADPAEDYPYFLGYADEYGAGAGEGYNLNYPLPFGTDWSTYQPALADSLEQIMKKGAEVLVVSLGLDTFEDDPISKFNLTTADYGRMGQMLAKIGLPTLFVLEGGYDTESLGTNAGAVFNGFEGG